MDAVGGPENTMELIMYVILYKVIGLRNVAHARHSNHRLFWWLCRRGPYALSIDFPFATRLAFSCEGVVLVKDFFLIVEKSYECEHNPTSNYVPQLVGRVHN